MISALGLDLTLRELEEGRFAAGSMFCSGSGRPCRRWADPALDSLFAPERGQLDGTAAHAAETIVRGLTHRQGYLAAGTEALPGFTMRPKGARRSGDGRDRGAVRTGCAEPIRPADVKFWQRHPWMLIAAHHVYTPLAATHLARRAQAVPPFHAGS